MLDLVSTSSVTEPGVDLATAFGRTVRLTGLSNPLPPGTGPVRDEYAFSWAAFLLGILAAIGWGLAARSLLARWGFPTPESDPVLALCVVPLYAVLFFGLIATLATWFQVPVPWRVVLWIGVGLAILFALRPSFFRSVLSAAAKRPAATWAPEAILLAALLLFLFWRQANFPFSAGDPRVIWLLAGKRLAHNGFITHHDVTVLTQRTEPGYPLLYPATMAALAALARLNQRMLSMAVPFLFAAEAITLWVLSRRALGRWVGFAFTLVVVLSVPHLSTVGNADPHLLMLVIIAFLVLAGAAAEPVGWMALGIAALTKQEGVIIALVIAIAFLATTPRISTKRARAFLPLLWLLPAVGHALIGLLFLNLPQEFTSAALRHPLEWAPARLSILWRLTPWTLSFYPIARIGLASIPITVVLLIATKKLSKVALVATATAVVTTGVFVGLMYVTSLDPWIHVATAMYRLVLVPAALGFLGLLLALRLRADPRAAPAYASGLSNLPNLRERR